MNREDQLRQLRDRTNPWDIVVIGGGATGVGIAMDAASRGLDVLLLEQSDFGKGTSSRSTKLVHGGVRYLRQGNITLVRDALRERSLLKTNAPHLVHDLAFLIPCRNLWQRFFYGVGLKIYDLLAAGNNFATTRRISKLESIQQIPTLKPEIVSGGVVYHDGQFDDTRLLINMVQTAHEQGGCVLNYVCVDAISKDASGAINGVRATDQESDETFDISARAVVNAAGPFCDAVRQMDDPKCEPMLSASQGVHIVLPRKLFPGNTAIMVPKTPDGRVLFVIPWHDHAIVGTTDTPIDEVSLEPSAQTEEIQFLLSTAAKYLVTPPQKEDILSVFVGIRPLVKGDKSARTASLSRDHVIRVSESGLVTITGGKWTTVRKMAEDCVDRVVKEASLHAKLCCTRSQRIHGYVESDFDGAPRSFYGTDLALIQQLESETPDFAKPLHSDLTITAAEVIWVVRHEMARTVEDVLARRTRALFLNARAALAIAPNVVELMAAELGRDETWCEQQREAFRKVAQFYLPQSIG
ncbi:glycerol-3-phosphate dehydrogenase/oxidase [Planctomycetes bacterium CA13]